MWDPFRGEVDPITGRPLPPTQAPMLPADMQGMPGSAPMGGGGYMPVGNPVADPSMQPLSQPARSEMFNTLRQDPGLSAGRVLGGIVGAPFNMLHGLDQELKGALGIPTIADDAAMGHKLYGSPTGEGRAFGTSEASEPDFGDRFVGAFTGRPRRDMNAAFMTMMAVRQRNAERKMALGTARDVQQLQIGDLEGRLKAKEVERDAQWGDLMAQLAEKEKRAEIAQSQAATWLSVLKGGRAQEEMEANPFNPATGLTRGAETSLKYERPTARQEYQRTEQDPIDPSTGMPLSELSKLDKQQGLTRETENLQTLRATAEEIRLLGERQRDAAAAGGWGALGQMFGGSSPDEIKQEHDARIARVLAELFRTGDVPAAYEALVVPSEPTSVPTPAPSSLLSAPSPTPGPPLTLERVETMSPEEKEAERADRESLAAKSPSVPRTEDERKSNALRVSNLRLMFDAEFKAKGVPKGYPMGGEEYKRKWQEELAKRGLTDESVK